METICEKVSSILMEMVHLAETGHAVPSMARGTLRAAGEEMHGDVYGGRIGIFYGLALAGRFFGWGRMHDWLLPRVISEARKPRSVINSGYLSGWAGELRALERISELLGFPDESEATLQEAWEKCLAGQNVTGRCVDFIGGLAGTVAALSTARLPDPDVKVERLRVMLATIQKRTVYVGGHPVWPSPMPSYMPLCGFAHGASGMAIALGIVSRLLNSAIVESLVLGAVDYEREEFSRAGGHFPDHRIFDEKVREMFRDTTVVRYSRSASLKSQRMDSWCHGAPGILLARLGLHSLGFSGMSVEIRRISGLVADGFERDLRCDRLSYSVCHGLAGSLIIDALYRLHTGESLGWDRDRCKQLLEKFLLDINIRTMLLPGAPVDGSLFLGLAGLLVAIIPFSDARFYDFMTPILTSGEVSVLGS